MPSKTIMTGRFDSNQKKRETKRRGVAVVVVVGGCSRNRKFRGTTKFVSGSGRQRDEDERAGRDIPGAESAAAAERWKRFIPTWL